MNQPDEQPPDRRELLRSAARWLAGGGICLGSAGLIARSASTGTDDRCRVAGDCRDCAVLARCGLRQAAVTRGRKRR